MELVYPRGFYEHQVKGARPCGALLESSTLQVRVRIDDQCEELLLQDALEVCRQGDGVDDELRLVARGTVSRVRMSRNLRAGLKKGRYSEPD